MSMPIFKLRNNWILTICFLKSREVQLRRLGCQAPISLMDPFDVLDFLWSQSAITYLVTVSKATVLQPINIKPAVDTSKPHYIIQSSPIQGCATSGTQSVILQMNLSRSIKIQLNIHTTVFNGSSINSIHRAELQMTTTSLQYQTHTTIPCVCGCH